MTLFFIRGFFLLICGVVGQYVGTIMQDPVLGLQIGLVCGLAIILLEKGLQRVSLHGLSSMVFGLLLGVFMAKLVADILLLLPLGEFIQSVSRVILTLFFSYFGAVMALRGKDEFNVIIPYVRFRRQDVGEEKILLDTSTVIDGRILDISRLKFLRGPLIVPRFVLGELQALADSADDIKRQRGKRGMTLLQEMQKDRAIDIHIQEEDVINETEVDSKLIRLAKMMDVRLCTTDSNLAHVASLQGVEVLNLQEIAHALLIKVSEGDTLNVKLVREGKEPEQALAYCDDGTLIVVADGKACIGQKVDIVVTSVLQTGSGKMIFAKLR